MPRSSYCASADHRGGIGEDGKRSTITLGAIERLAGENLAVNLQESKQIVNRPAFPACDRR
jgi:hypothetical protein